VYASSVAALDLATGALRWSFQTVEHDLREFDVPSQPSLIDLTIDSAAVPALVQASSGPGERCRRSLQCMPRSGTTFHRSATCKTAAPTR
jgi:hypothetical protein